MYAVIKAGGKQQRVKPGDVIEIERIHGIHAGESITLPALLVVDDDGKTHYGKEAARAQVKAKLLGEEKGDKVKVFKYRPKSGYARRQGHRQMQALVEIEEISLGRRAARKAEEPAKKTDDEPAKKAAQQEPAVEAAPAPAPASEEVGSEPSAGVTVPAEATEAADAAAAPDDAAEADGEEEAKA